MTHAIRALCALLLVSSFVHAADTFSLFGTNATWRFRKGQTEASAPDPGAWRGQSFADSGFTDSAAPFSYGEGLNYGTVLTDMQNSYSCLFLRKQFTITNLAEIGALRLGAKVDDGFVAWVNGVEVLRVNFAGEPGSDVYATNLAANATEPVPFVFYDITNRAALVAGNNVLAVQVFNTSLASSDLVFDASLDAVLTETVPPVIAQVTPAPGSLTTLTQLVVRFSEPVNGVNADDLLVNNVSATSVAGSGDTYTFVFAQPEYGLVRIRWSGSHGIVDQAQPPNPFNAEGAGATWEYTLVDVVAPTVAQLRPAAGTTVRTLGEVRVTFSEGVAGVNASDLLVNGAPATNVTAQPGSAFVFQFPEAPAGPVQFAWAAGHGITDLAPVPNAFTGDNWSNIVDPNASLVDIVINEILAANITGIGDSAAGEFEPHAWIELHNRGGATIDLSGWSLSDDPDFPDRWVFPARTIDPGEYLVVFASGLNVTNATGTNRLHTNFKLSRAGEFIGLYSADSPRVLVSGFEYPEQRNDHSYGNETSTGQRRYFATPSPGAANGSSAIAGVVEPVHFNVARGHFTQPFDLLLTCETRGAQIRYTTNGAEPTLTTGLPYNGPIRISSTMMIRAAAFRTNMLSSKISTHTYLFNLTAAQRSLPVISIVTDQNNLTGPTGIIGISNVTLLGDGRYVPANTNGYHNPSQHGIAWERPTSVELIQWPNNEGFQADAGLRVQGSDYQRPRTTVNSKFSFRLYFRSVYGQGRLAYPLFPLGSALELDQVVLRAGFNDNTDPFIRDELARRLSHDMGQIAAHGTVANLFVNGVYKGYYNPTERVHEEFFQSYLGGSNKWDVVAPSFATSASGLGVIDGDRNNFVALVNYVNAANVNDAATYAEIGHRLDLTNFVDYLLVNAYSAMGDWPQNNWRAGKDRSRYPWRFIVWDAEWAMGIYSRAVTLNTFTMNGPGPDLSGLASPDSEIAQMFQRLRNSPEFRLLWADRVQKHMFNGGALTDANITNRFLQLRAQMSAVLPNMAQDIMNNWVPNRRSVLFSHMQAIGLMASSNAPVFSQFGGRVSPGFQLTMTASNGTIYFTTNGADPRVPYSGAISNSAVAYTGPLSIGGNMVVKARTRDSGGNWSALTEAAFEVALLGTPIRITEIHYNPADSPNFEFIELMNVGSTPVDLGRAYFEGITFQFNLGTIVPPGGRLVLATDLNPAAFTARYPGVNVAGYYSGSLNNGGERITLRDAAGNIITSVDYDDANGWAPAADGRGFSIENINPLGDPHDPANWRALANGGTPQASSPAPPPSSVRLNEVMAYNVSAVNNGGTFPDYIELVNSSGSPVSLNGYSLTDDGDARKFVFGDITLPAGGFLTVWCDAVTNTSPGLHTGFSLGSNGDRVFLYDAQTNLLDAVSIGLQVADHSVGRISGEWRLNSPTPSAANMAANVGAAASLTINEFLSNPLPGESDWLELFNNSALPVSLQGVFLSTTTGVHQVTSLSFVPPYGFVQLFANEGTGPDEMSFRLPAAGGSIVLHSALGVEVNRVSYSAQAEGVSRGRLPDGTATIVNFVGTASPAASNYVASYSGPIINEVLARHATITNGAVADYIELYNPSPNAFSLAGMSLRVESPEAGEWTFPPGATLAGQSYLVIWCNGDAPASTNGTFNTGRSLSGDSGGVYLFNAAGQLVNSVEYGFQVSDMPIGLVGNAWRLLASVTPGAANGSVASLGSATALRINEWLADADSGADWFELYNSTNAPVDMTGLWLTDTPTTAGTNQFRVPPLSFVGPNGFVQWVADGNVDEGRNHVNFSLDGGGEVLRIYATNGTTIIDTASFGLQRAGVSQGRLPEGATNMVSFPGSATPGGPNYRLITDVVVNEVLTYPNTASNPQAEAGIELRNTSGMEVSVGGWYLSNDERMLKKYRIPDGTVIGAGGYLVINQSQFNTGPQAFTLNRARGGEVWLSGADGQGNITGYRSGLKFGAAHPQFSFGSHYVGQERFTVMHSARMGLANLPPLTVPWAISEIMYHPPEGVPGAAEFIEIYNARGGQGSSLPLYDIDRPTNTFRLGGGISFIFPQGASVPGTGHVLVVNFDPVADPAQLAAFRALYGVPESVAVYGPFTGRLSNSGDTVELLEPGVPDGDFVPMIVVDQVRFRDTSPWPVGAADGGGHSLQKDILNGFGSDPANWVAAAPTPGAGTPASSLKPLVQPPASTNLLTGDTLVLRANATGPGPLHWQWRFNGVELPGETNVQLTIEFVRLDDSGIYDAVVWNASGVVVSAGAQVSVVEPPYILTAPSGTVTANPGANATFTISAGGTAPLRFQWRFNGVDIPGATGPSLTISNVVLEHSGLYSAVVSNNYGVAVSNFVFVALVRPTITAHPSPQTIAQGGTAIFAVTAGPIHPSLPLTYRWLRTGSPIATSSVPYLVLTNVQVGGTFRCQVVNLAGNQNSSNVTLTVLADFDGDGMGDPWEVQHGFDTNSVADGAIDHDGDGMKSRDEFIAGTNPTNALSVLKLEPSSTEAGALQFVAQPGLFYGVEFNSNLATGVWTLTTNFVASPSVRTTAVHVPVGPSGERYVRVITPAIR
jgi:hypothetical protein